MRTEWRKRGKGKGWVKNGTELGKDGKGKGGKGSGRGQPLVVAYISSNSDNFYTISAYTLHTGILMYTRIAYDYY